ncbi:unnamed protein product [Orchesella dallaii]|uniref:Uncharacterized protein n=1 Tax=Orchesella dallaii TaxID=48710 RepID=A0ABP1PJF9_9HEXA
MLISEPKLRDIRRAHVGHIYLVPELCYPCGLTDELRSNFRLMKEFAHCLHMPTAGRFKTMQKFMDGIPQNESIQTYISNHGMANVQFNYGPVELIGRQLPPEEIMCGNGQVTLSDDKADWTNASQNVMILGYDVHHAGPGDGGMSIGAMTVSHLQCIIGKVLFKFNSGTITISGRSRNIRIRWTNDRKNCMQPPSLTFCDCCNEYLGKKSRNFMGDDDSGLLDYYLNGAKLLSSVVQLEIA